MRLMVSAEKILKSKDSWIETMKQKKTEKVFALCVDNRDCEDLEKKKLYEVIADDKALKEGFLRVIDESGEDYLYPVSYFIILNLPSEAQEALRMAG
jgi:hypothetical protein